MKRIFSKGNCIVYLGILLAIIIGLIAYRHFTKLKDKTSGKNDISEAVSSENSAEIYIDPVDTEKYLNEEGVGNILNLKTEETLYYEYLKNELIPQYGLASTESFTIEMNPSKTLDGIAVYGMFNENYGIVDIDIDDYNGDGHKEMLVLSLEEEYDEQHICNMVLSLYGINSDEISLYDSSRIHKYSMESGIEHCYNFFRLEKNGNKFLFTNNCFAFSGEIMYSLI